MVKNLSYRSMLSFFCMALVVVLSGCASPEAVREMTQGKTIAVASAVGDDLNLSWIGTTIFNNEFGKLSGWNLDEVITRAAIKDLQNSGRFQRVIAIKATPNYKDQKIPEGVDFLVHIHPKSGPQMMEYLNGVGVTRRTMYGLEGYTYGHVLLFLTILNTESDRVSNSFENTVWVPPFKLESGLQIPAGEIQNYKAENEKKIQETVTSLLQKVGLIGALK